MLDTLQTVKKFKQITSFVTVLASGYINVGNFDYGPIFSSFVIMKWRRSLKSWRKNLFWD
jgi:hypothetical protein